MTYQFTSRLGKLAPRYPNEIRRYRLAAELSQRELAERVGAQRSSVSTWERGRTLPRLWRVFRLAKTLNTLAENLYYPLYRPHEYRRERRRRRAARR